MEILRKRKVRIFMHTFYMPVDVQARIFTHYILSIFTDLFSFMGHELSTVL